MRNNYKKVLEKSYFHHDIYGFPDKDTIILLPNPSTKFGDEEVDDKFIFFNINTFEIEYLPSYGQSDGWEAPKLTFKLNDEKYLHYQKKKWRIVRYNGNNFDKIEDLKNENILGDNVYFINNYRIITYKSGESKIKFMKY